MWICVLVLHLIVCNTILALLDESRHSIGQPQEPLRVQQKDIFKIKSKSRACTWFSNLENHWYSIDQRRVYTLFDSLSATMQGSKIHLFQSSGELSEECIGGSLHSHSNLGWWNVPLSPLLTSRVDSGAHNTASAPIVDPSMVLITYLHWSLLFTWLFLFSSYDVCIRQEDGFCCVEYTVWYPAQNVIFRLWL